MVRLEGVQARKEWQCAQPRAAPSPPRTPKTNAPVHHALRQRQHAVMARHHPLGLDDDGGVGRQDAAGDLRGRAWLCV